MAIEITPKTQIRKIVWPIIFLIICMVLLLVLFTSYFYFNESSKEISQDIQNKERALIKTSSERLLEKELFAYESKINTFGRLLSVHQKTLNVFSFLEQVSHPKVWFNKFDFNSSSKTVNVSGEAKDFIALGQQLLTLKEAELLKKVNLSGISISKEGGVDFSLQLTFKPQIFK